jgi:tripartite-type tricarboxylate transporter receptor subunit TctC
MLTPCAPALAQEDVYKGKTIRLIVGSEAGGGYDAYGRLLATHMVKYIPGHPTIIVQNMPGAGALVLANHMANVLANDITAIGGVNPLVATHPLYTPDMAKYDARKLAWIGSMQADTFVAIARRDAPVQKFSDVFEKEFVVGGSGGASTEYPPIVNAALGTKFKLVLGYKGTSSSMLAVERGEVEGLGAQTLASLKAQSSRLLADKSIKILVQYTQQRDPEIPDVPTIYEFAKTDADRKFLTAVFAYQGVGRSFIMPPGMPDNVVAIMRKAFDDTMKDKDFLEEAKKRKIDLGPQSGAPIQKLVEEIASTPPEIIARINQIKSQQK